MKIIAKKKKTKTKLFVLPSFLLNTNLFSEITNRGMRCFQKYFWPFISKKKILVKFYCKGKFKRFRFKDMWPYLSLDLNPMYFRVWSIWKQKVFTITHQIINAFKIRLVKKMDELPQKRHLDYVGNFREEINIKNFNKK